MGHQPNRPPLVEVQYCQKTCKFFSSGIPWSVFRTDKCLLVCVGLLRRDAPPHVWVSSSSPVSLLVVCRCAILSSVCTIFISWYREGKFWEKLPGYKAFFSQNKKLVLFNCAENWFVLLGEKFLEVSYSRYSFLKYEILRMEWSSKYPIITHQNYQHGRQDANISVSCQFLTDNSVSHQTQDSLERCVRLKWRAYLCLQDGTGAGGYLSQAQGWNTRPVGSYQRVQGRGWS